MTNRVWFDARSLSRGYTSGWERYVRELAKYLPHLIDVTLWSPNTKNRFSLILSDFNSQKSQMGHQIVHYPTYPPLKIEKNIKKIITIHDLTWWNFPETSSFLGKNYYKKNMESAILNSDLIITPSQAIKSELTKKFSISPKNIKAISHGNSLPLGKIKKITKPYFLSVGTVEPRKNLDFYSDAIKKSNLQKHFDFLHIGRSGWGRLPDNLRIVKVDSDQELADLIINSRALVIPSIYEGFGLPVLESHAQGKPVIMSNVEALIELANPQDQIFDLNDLDSLMDKLSYFANNEFNLDNNHIEEARNFTWLKSAQEHVKTYLGLINE